MKVLTRSITAVLGTISAILRDQQTQPPTALGSLSLVPRLEERHFGKQVRREAAEAGARQMAQPPTTSMSKQRFRCVYPLAPFRADSDVVISGMTADRVIRLVGSRRTIYTHLLRKNLGSYQIPKSVHTTPACFSLRPINGSLIGESVKVVVLSRVS